MKRIPLLILAVLCASCSAEQDCCDTLPFFPKIRILDSSNKDLLYPRNEDFFEHSKISIKSEEDPLRNLHLEIEEIKLNDFDHGKYRIDVEDAEIILPDTGSMKFYLCLDDTEIDTIEVKVENSRTTRLELNGEEWTETDAVYLDTHIIRK